MRPTPSHNLFSIFDQSTLSVTGCALSLPIYIIVTVNNYLKSVLITVSGDRAPVREDCYAGYDGGT